jgi:hypothetical protein
LLLFADEQFERSAKAADGNAKGEHLDAAKRHPLYREPQAPVCAQLPFELAHVWQFFVQMNRKRQSGMAVNPLSSLEVLAWQLRHRIRLTTFEEDLIDRLDGAYLAYQNTSQ